MRRWTGGALAALAVLIAMPRVLAGQDTTVAMRHLLSLDLSRVQPFHRSYDMLVYTGDSARAIGQRDVILTAATYAGNPVWLLVETRSGLVPAAESLYVASDMRPVHWSATLGAARLGAEFSGDSIYGATSTPAGKHSLVLASRPDLLVSTAMIEAILPLLPLAADWSDSSAVLAVDAGSGSILPVEVAVTGEEAMRIDPADTTAARPSWIVTVRSERAQVQFWVVKDTGEIRRVEQALPAHVGSRLEFRPRAPVAPVIPPPQ